ncbi:MAG: hydrogenase expression/formation protein HypE [Lachnospiraceae bacterium]|jgi:hydrogenase expression/formation protein HypE|nr:hydrogenase expression/formation protein HypE [Lachnospiraceae bacterium]MBQ1403849.1 hydrogenase expression/formation protein HypE [Lachnospiraceae bacterium]MBQ9050395.1 hydrogenase expression/formation protein HypE [Lachnospiraceae bacterium]
MPETVRITMEHGSGGQATGELIGEIFAPAFRNEVLGQMEDSAVVSGSGRIAVTTDSFVVTPLVFRGGDIGRLCVCGTVNDLLMRGAVPRYLTCGFILEEGLEIELLRRIVRSLAETAAEAGVQIIAGDTKVIEGNGGLIINTTGVGSVPDGLDISAGNAGEGDAVLVSGTMGDHHAAILGERLQIESDIESDCAPLGEIVKGLLDGGIRVRTLRDVTRGGLGTVLKELAEASGKCFIIEEDAVPVSARVRDFCGLLGLDPLYMGNEGKLVAVVPREQAAEALEIMKNARYGSGAAVIGKVAGAGEGTEAGELLMRTQIGGVRRLTVLQGEGLPRIC